MRPVPAARIVKGNWMRQIRMIGTRKIAAARIRFM